MLAKYFFTLTIVLLIFPGEMAAGSLEKVERNLKILQQCEKLLEFISKLENQGPNTQRLKIWLKAILGESLNKACSDCFKVTIPTFAIC